MLSTHKVEVVPVALSKHENADTLSVVSIFNGGYNVCVRSSDWVGKTLGAWIPPDSVVDVTRPDFSFLAKGTKTKHRVRAVKLRGVQSFGLLMPAPEGSQIGDDVAEYYGVEHYEPELHGACTGGEAEQAPAELSQLPKYDVDAMRRYSTIFRPGELVMVTEKIHGANSRFCFMDGRMWCGSRSQWKRQEEGSIWWKALNREPSIQCFCERWPGYVLYGEVYGAVQSLTYGCGRGEIRFAAFDILRSDGTFVNAREFRTTCENYEVPLVPLIRGSMAFDFEDVCKLAEGGSLVPGAKHIREGCVVRPMVERFHQAIGRVQLKVVSATYLEKN